MAPNDKRVQVKIEVGHQSVCRENKTPAGHTHDWSIFVRGAEGADISHFVEKVVFLLHESFPRPKRVSKEPPYKVSETGYGSFNLPVEIYFRNKEEPRKYRLEYDLTLQLVGMPPFNFTKVELLTFLNPSEDFEKRLRDGGASVLRAHGNSPASSVPVKPEVTKNSPASPQASASPNGTKKVHSSKTKVKDTTLLTNGIQSSKRVGMSDDTSAPKPKKKKLEKGGGTSSIDSGGSAVLKEISILSPGGTGDVVDPLKVKTTLNTKKVKEVKERRKSIDYIKANDFSSVSESPKGIPKEAKIKGKEMKVKKERDKDKDRDREKEKEKDREKDKERDKERAAEKEREKEQRELEKAEKESEKDRDKPEKEKDKEKSRDKEKSKEKKEKRQSPDQAKEDPPKLQKFTIKRTAGDAWSSTAATNSNLTNGTILANTVTTNAKQNERVNKLFAEFLEDDSNSEDEMNTSNNTIKEDIKPTRSSALRDEEISIGQSSPYSPPENNNNDNNLLNNNSSTNTSGNSSTLNGGTTTKIKKSKVHKSSGLSNGKVHSSKKELSKKSRDRSSTTVVHNHNEDSNSSTTSSTTTSSLTNNNNNSKSQPPIPKCKISPSGSGGGITVNHVTNHVTNHTNHNSSNSSSTLVELYKKINELEDEDSLQNIVDIVEASGVVFEVTDSTFDFDLVGLDSDTLEQIKQCLESCS